MTWSARLTRPDGTNPITEGNTAQDYSACMSCAHGQPSVTLPNGHKTAPCSIPKVSSLVGSLLTSIDVGIDGHMAPGEALLKCSGYEVKE